MKMTTLQESLKALEKLLASEANTTRLDLVASICSKHIQEGGKIIVADDDDSAFLGNYFVDRFNQGFLYSEIEAITKTDLLLAVSVDPHSKIVLEAVHEAHKRGAYTVAMITDKSGPLLSSCKFQWRVPSENTDAALLCIMALLQALTQKLQGQINDSKKFR